MNDHARIDVLMLLEGTYPYIKGGVSSWVHEIISGLPELRFGAVFLGSRQHDYRGIQYALPENLVHLESHYLFDHDGPVAEAPSKRVWEAAPTVEKAIADYHDTLETRSPEVPSQAVLSDPDSPLGQGAFFDSENAWHYLCKRYDESAQADSFVDYFWTVRSIHAPLWLLGNIQTALPAARMVFAPSTGYAGLLGAMCANERGMPFVLMEHGLYTRERRIDMLNADWIRDRRNFLQTHQAEISHLRNLWVRFFQTVARQSYARAHPVISLFERARQQQVSDGAEAERTRIIPNGVDIERFARLRRPLDAPVPPVMALIGRVVPIKDIKNFIRAAAVARQQLSALQAWIVGPEDEDPDYALECRELVQSLGIEDTVQFLGFQRVDEILPKIGVLVLSSVSEGLPLSVLEGFAAGIPAVTTDVGACREMIEGGPADNDVEGAAGAVVGLADPGAMAARVVELLGDEPRYRAAVATATARVERRYDRRQMLATFDTLFREAIG